ncbi:hypothetical protein [Sphingopyxis solisilvae]|nr:hypothetical protein [Sphingopyxis solisilvae]
MTPPRSKWRARAFIVEAWIAAIVVGGSALYGAWQGLQWIGGWLR